MRRALVTGASTGIGQATVRALAKDGWEVIASARRADRLKLLADETDATYVVADLLADGVEEISRYVEQTGPIDALVNVAGGALGVDPVAEGNPDDWRWMYEINVVGTLKLTQALLPAIRERGGDLVFLTSTAGHDTYPGGAGYTAAKHAERMIADTLRQELVGEPVRVIEIAPGMVKTEEFSKNRFRGDASKAAHVYESVAEPLVAEDVAEAIRWALSLPEHVNIDSLIIRPREQATVTLSKRLSR